MWTPCAAYIPSSAPSPRGSAFNIEHIMGLTALASAVSVLSVPHGKLWETAPDNPLGRTYILQPRARCQRGGRSAAPLRQTSGETRGADGAVLLRFSGPSFRAAGLIDSTMATATNIDARTVPSSPTAHTATRAPRVSLAPNPTPSSPSPRADSPRSPPCVALAPRHICASLGPRSFDGDGQATADERRFDHPPHAAPLARSERGPRRIRKVGEPGGHGEQ
jgi:hypothetical protein